MTDIKQKALALVNEVFAEMGGSPIDYASLVGAGDVVTLALCRAIERHEAFRQEVSDALLRYYALIHVPHGLKDFIITKPDPLVEAMHDCGVDRFESWAGQLRAALDARGFEIREKNDD